MLKLTPPYGNHLTFDTFLALPTVARVSSHRITDDWTGKCGLIQLSSMEHDPGIQAYLQGQQTKPSLESSCLPGE